MQPGTANETEILHFHPSLEYLEYVGQRSLYAETILDHTSSFLQLNNLGAFVKYDVSGVNKLISIPNTCNKAIFTAHQEHITANRYSFYPMSIHLYLNELIAKPRRILHRLSRENPQCTIWTNLGYFIVKRLFDYWRNIVIDVEKDLKKYLLEEVGKEGYESFYLQTFNLFQNIYSNGNGVTAISNSGQLISQKDLSHLHKSVGKSARKIAKFNLNPAKNNLKSVEEKTMLKLYHVPFDFHHYLDQIKVSTYFFTVHPENLTNKTFENLNDVKMVTDVLWHSRTNDYL